ncbi:phage major tail tube protein [Azospirillum doebereinerae]|uniref:Phage major tail tube protein n=1 Tax=Azospirillum doebereinerae TaxID=92933 RepID=A0A3S0VKI9_9PROT|nr:phage major tail tube protein [Azospirillum doebereinerae]MCG5240436.1 phage major tail tube protein [Azospirillum doebereinerae]RUQ74926.1 phage major tail tube protein [Azospirillum doebereinerae]
MAIQFPRVLKNMSLFVDGSGYAGRVDVLTLPKLVLKTAEHRAGGMDMTVLLDMGMEKLEAILKLSDFDPDLFRSFGLLDTVGIPVTLRGAFQAQGSAEVSSVVVSLRGGWVEMDAGEWKMGGEKSTLTVKMAVRYYKLTMNGDDLVEIDAVNMVRTIGGIDQLAVQRAAIGL